MTHHRIPALLAALLLAVPLAIPLAAQPSQADDAPTFGEIVDVRVINLEVVVTDRGERVEGLGTDAFRLLVDGREVPIEYFNEVRGGRAVEAADVAASGTVPALAPGEVVGTRYLVFIDDYFTIPSYRNRMLRELGDQLTLLEPEDRMAIVAFDGRQVEMLSSWTRSLPELSGALESARERRAYGLQRLSEQRNFDAVSRFERRGIGARLATSGSVGAVELHRAKELAGQVARVIDGATSTLRAFAKPPGRKVMLLLSGGWPASPERWVLGTFNPSVETVGLDSGYELYKPLTETANRLGYTLYTVDVNRNSENLYGNAEYGGVAEAAARSSLAYERDLIEEEMLLDLAAATGGKAFLDGARFGALERAVEDTRSYYWLGFSASWQGDDQEHRVKVEVVGKGVKVRTRKSFSDLSSQSEVTMLVESAQLFDLPLPGERALGVAMGEPTKAGYRKVVVPVQLTIPLDQVTVLPEGGGYVAQLELRVAATEADGDRAEMPVLVIELRGDGQPRPGQTAVFETSLKLRRQPHRLLLSLYDPPSGNVMSKRVELSI